MTGNDRRVLAAAAALAVVGIGTLGVGIARGDATAPSSAVPSTTADGRGSTVEPVATSTVVPPSTSAAPTTHPVPSTTMPASPTVVVAAPTTHVDERRDAEPPAACSVEIALVDLLRLVNSDIADVLDEHAELLAGILAQALCPMDDSGHPGEPMSGLCDELAALSQQVTDRIDASDELELGSVLEDIELRLSRLPSCPRDVDDVASAEEPAEDESGPVEGSEPEPAANLGEPDPDGSDQPPGDGDPDHDATRTTVNRSDAA